jgi:uncharacterized membrane protein (UPF0127 family)
MNSRIDPRLLPRGWLLALCVAGCALLAYAGAARTQTPTPALEELSAFPQTTLTVSGAGGSHPFNVWIADTAPRSEQGLMFVRELPPDKGMVFAEPQPRVWNMWMKNTYVPLDMLFVAVDGHVVKIAHAIPHDETTISSDVVVHGVIELQGGICEKLHIKVGDVAKWKAPT